MIQPIIKIGKSHEKLPKRYYYCALDFRVKQKFLRIYILMKLNILKKLSDHSNTAGEKGGVEIS